ncbi:MAG: hypothetical protein IT212_05960 [Bacteroidia bacterium]|nr:hypothetical protein [Bacteroidia bacterium]
MSNIKEMERKLIAEIQKRIVAHNCVAQIAKNKYKRNYITPEDIGEALKTNNATKVRLDVLEIMADNAGFGTEDRGLCAFVAFQGKKR